MNSSTVRYIDSFLRYIRLRRLGRTLNGITFSANNSGRIALASARTNPFYLAHDFTIAYILSKMGYTVCLIVNDGMLLHQDTTRYNAKLLTSENRYSSEFNSKDKPSRLLGLNSWTGNLASSIRIAAYSELLAKDPVDTDSSRLICKQVMVGEISDHVDASHRRYFGGRSFNRSNRDHVEYAKISAINELTGRQVALATLNKFKPDLYITLDGIYSTFGPGVEIMKSNQVPVVFYQPNGFRDRSIFIGNSPYSIQNISQHWCEYSTNYYGEELAQKARNFLNERINNGYAFDKSDPEQNTIQNLLRAKKKFQKTIVLFPNLTWDGAIRERNTCFSGLDDWLEQTVRWSKNREILLIIREHPQSIDDYNNLDSSLAMLRELVPDISSYDNIRLIKGTEPVNSYGLASNVADLSIVYNGTLGVEISYMDKPVLISAESPYSHKAVAYEPRNKQEYFYMLEHISEDSLDFQENRHKFGKNALRAAAYQFIFNTYYSPLMPTLKAFRSKNRYWQSWDDQLSCLDPEINSDWLRTLNRLVEPLA